MKPTLLVLAAGMGSRYGGLKQMDGLGPNGETIIDYSIYDAVQAGFGKVVYIVREYFKEQFEETVKQKYSHVKCLDGEPLQFQFVTQELNKIPAKYTLNPERQKPWGTAHAVLMAKDVIREPFAVINGDDYYGRIHSASSATGSAPMSTAQAYTASSDSSLTTHFQSQAAYPEESALTTRTSILQIS